jgi:carbon dioxide concentrating mechanism protein CcmO
LTEALGLLEINGLTPAIVALDAMEKAGDIRLLQAELNDALGVVLKISGNVAAVRAAIDSGRAVAETMNGKPVADILPRVHPDALAVIQSKPEFNPLIMQDVIFIPKLPAAPASSTKEINMADKSFALGLIETQGFTAVYEAIDRACKAASVEVVGKEKLGGGFITIVIKGDVAAVTAAVDAGKAHVEGLGKLIAAHVIARPSEGVLSLLPKL